MEEKKNTSNELQIKMPLSIKQLDYFISFAFCNDYGIVNYGSLKKLKDLAYGIDITLYQNDRKSTARIYLLKSLMTGIIDKKITQSEELVEMAKRQSQYEEDIDEIIDDINELWGERDIENSDLLNIDELISDIIKYSFIFKYQDELDELSLKLKSNDYDNLHDICFEYENLITKLNTGFKKASELRKDGQNDFNSNDGSLHKAVSQSLNVIKSPYNKIKTSIMAMNDMLNGGFECGRFYLVVGKQSGGKSKELLGKALDIKHSNPGLAEFPDGRKGVILFITQENSIRETLERIWSYYNGDLDEFEKHNDKEIIELLKEKGFSEGAEIEFKYRKTKSISTDDINTMIEEIESNGSKKVVMFIHDYLLRIRSTKDHPKEYNELGYITDEFAAICKDKDTCGLSAMQFNRAGLMAIEEAVKKNKDDAVKSVNNSSIGDSVKIVHNCDVIYMILEKVDSDGNLTMSYSLTKFRGKLKPNAIRFFIHPYEQGNTMKLVSDIGMAKSLSILKPGNNLEEFDPVEARKKKRSNQGGRPDKKITTKEIEEKTTKQKIDDENLNKEKLRLMDLMSDSDDE